MIQRAGARLDNIIKPNTYCKRKETPGFEPRHPRNYDPPTVQEPTGFEPEPSIYAPPSNTLGFEPGPRSEPTTRKREVPNIFRIFFVKIHT